MHGHDHVRLEKGPQYICTTLQPPEPLPLRRLAAGPKVAMEGETLFQLMRYGNIQRRLRLGRTFFGQCPEAQKRPRGATGKPIFHTGGSVCSVADWGFGGGHPGLIFFEPRLLLPCGVWPVCGACRFLQSRSRNTHYFLSLAGGAGGQKCAPLFCGKETCGLATAWGWGWALFLHHTPTMYISPLG